MRTTAGAETNARELSVILVNFNDRAHLPACLGSLEKALSGLSAEVILVDNRSGDGSPELVKASFPGVTLIENDQNVGFPKANNLGFRHSRGEFILFLNTDTVVPADAPARLLAEIKARPEAGAVGPALVQPNGRFQVSFGKSVGFFSEMRQKLILNPYYGIALRHSGRPRAVGWLSGACFLARREALQAAGLFDEGYFLYFEDIDLCRRMAEKGFSLVLYPGVRVFHVGGAATSSRRWPSRLEYRRSQLRFYEKHSSRLSLRFLKIYLRLTIMALGLSSRRNEEIKLYRQGLREVLAGPGACADR
jgi:GT2 family glycosyltransferase